LTVTLVREVERTPRVAAERLSKVKDRDQALADCTALTGRLAPGIDFSREQELTERFLLGDTTLVYRDGTLSAFALWHSAPLADARGAEELRVLKCVATDGQALAHLLEATVQAAGQEGLKRVGLRAQSAYAGAYGALIADGWRAHWTDLRMTLEGFHEAPVQGDGVVWSNWEI
ncbi:MAG TPA: hypothetical protein VG712_00450, partial [Gemmatimonadales bacterium]|nr:hypothetical protein [Gemmatimonadales bacterium]